jgi:catechol 2,3-dioxygenase-like lactoylglutathione lyase family enzyme
MKVKKTGIVANITTPNPGAAKGFYQDVLGLELLMDHGWIATYGRTKSVQVSFATKGGSGARVPDLSIEVDDLDDALSRMKKAIVAIEYGPTEEPWGVRRFFVRDLFGKLVNILDE